MNRLTKWNGKKFVLPQGYGMWREIAERLAAYENTGLEPEEIEILKVRNQQLETICDECAARNQCLLFQTGDKCAYKTDKEENQNAEVLSHQ